MSYRNKSPWKEEKLMVSSAPKNSVFAIYDHITFLILKSGMVDFTHWFRYILGQRIKKMLGQNR